MHIEMRRLVVRELLEGKTGHHLYNPCIGCVQSRWEDNDIPHDILILMELSGLFNTDTPTVYL